MTWQGVWIALPTPFSKGEVDYPAIEKLIDRLLKAGIHGISPCGTTGEGTALTEKEFSSIVSTVIKKVNGKIPVVPGTGSNNTEHTIERTKLAKSLGATGALIVTPYYVKPTQEGMVRHYSEVAKVGLPIMLYNVPGRTAVNLLPETVEKLMSYAEIKGVKECAPLPQVEELISRVGKKIAVFSGEDPTFVPFMSLGGVGIVSVTGNVVPEKFVSIFNHFKSSKLEEAKKEFAKLKTLIEVLFMESNPIPLKCALSLLKLCNDEVRLPLSIASEKTRARVEKELQI